MKKYSLIAALLMVVYVTMSSCSASARVNTKHHGVGAGTEVH